MLKLYFISLIALSPVLLYADDAGVTIRGETLHLEKKVITTKQLKTGVAAGRAKKFAHSNKSLANCPPCPPPPPFPVTGVVPTQNPNSPAVAFFPDHSVHNSDQLPPQNIGAITFISGATASPISGFPFNPSPCASCDQILYVSALSGGMLSYDRNLKQDNRVNTDLISFLNSDGDFSYFNQNQEIELRYDKFTDRFFFAVDCFSLMGNLENTGTTFGVSDRGEITDETIWTIVSVFDDNVIPDKNGCPRDITLTGAVFYDYCRAAIDKNAYYFAHDVFTMPSDLYVSTTGFVVQKESLINEGPAVVTVFRDVVGHPGDTDPYRNASSVLIPVMNFDDDAKFGHFICQDPLMWGKLLLFRVINPGSDSPTLSAAIPLDLPTTFNLIVPQLSAPFVGNVYSFLGVIYNIDDRFKMAHIRDKQLFTTHCIVVDKNGIGSENGDRLACRWYQIDVTGDKHGKGKCHEKATTLPALVQVGTLFDSADKNPIFYYSPAVMTNRRGDLSLTCILSGITQSISACFVGRLSHEPLGQLRIGKIPSDRIFAQGSGTLTQEIATYAGFTPPIFGQRLADRHYTCFDPRDDMTMWAEQEFIQNGLITSAFARLDAPTI